jgi:hypothetical protein
MWQKFYFGDHARLFLLSFLLSSVFQVFGLAFPITAIPRDDGDHGDPNNSLATPAQNDQ